MTDNEIIKALECCKERNGLNNQCDKCSFHGMYCMDKLVVNALGLINRQMDKNKAYQHYYDECLKDLKNANAEIERLKDLCREQNTEIMSLNETKHRLLYNLKAVLDERADHSEAVKEFAERLKEKLQDDCPTITAEEDDFSGYDIFETDEIIDNLVKEMVGDTK